MEVELRRVESNSTNQEDDIEVLVEESEVRKVGIWKVIDVSANNKAMEIQFNVQCLKMLTFVAFLVMNIVAIIITLAKYGGIPEPNIIKEALGANMICLFYDFPPATYVLPPLWAICVILGSFYCLTSIYRARLAQVENQITLGQRIFFNISSIGLAIAVIIFSICLAVQPDTDDIPNNPKPEDFPILKIHTYPFTNLMIWLVMEQVKIQNFRKQPQTTSEVMEVTVLSNSLRGHRGQNSLKRPRRSWRSPASEVTEVNII